MKFTTNLVRVYKFKLSIVSYAVWDAVYFDEQWIMKDV